MRKSFEAFASFAALAALAAYGASTVRDFRSAGASSPAEAVAAPSVVSSATAAPVLVAASQPAPAPSSDLPVMEVKPRDYHVVPEDAPALPVPAVTLRRRDGSLIEQTAASTAIAAPGAIRPTTGTDIGGAALATGGAGLSVEGHQVRLFGLRAPGPQDRCAATDGSVHSCGEMAQAALAARFAVNATVTCHMPQGQRGDPGYVCRDSQGVDLAGMLVAGGFAHADTKSSFDYVSAETTARTARLGLWRVR